MNKTVQAKDVPEAEVLALMAENHPRWTQSWDLERAFPRFPPKVLLAKMRALKKRGLVDGCGCGCRGDWELIPPKPIDVESVETTPRTMRAVTREGVPTSTVGFRVGDGLEVWTEEAVAGLVGQEVNVTAFGYGIGKGRVTDAKAYRDDILGPGVWITVDLPPQEITP